MCLASPADQTVVSATLERVEKAVVPPEQRVLAVYPLKSADTANFLQLLDPSVQQNSRIVPDAKRDVLIVWARPKDQESIRKALDEFQHKLPAGAERVSRVYRFHAADPSTTLTVLSTLVPGAQMAVDPRMRSLVINALPDDHAKIKSTITEIDREDTDRDAPVLQVHRVATGDPATVLATLQPLFATRPEVRLSLDAVNNQVIALASPAQHESIRAVIAEIEKGIPSDAGTRLEVYPLTGIDAANALQVLNTLLAKRAAKVRLSLDARSRQLVAIAPPEEQATIRQTLERLQAAEPVLEVLQLEVVEPFAAEAAIDKLFATEGGAKRADAPNVESDAAAQRLFVRATKAQLAQIRDLLVKMGETHLAKQASMPRSVRVIPFHGDPEAAVAEIRRVWPQLRGNPVRVVTPSAVLPTLRGRTPRQPEKAPPATTTPPTSTPSSKEGTPKKTTDEKNPPDNSSYNSHKGWHALRNEGRGFFDNRVSGTFDRQHLLRWAGRGRSRVPDAVSTPFVPQGVPPACQGVPPISQDVAAIWQCCYCAAAEDDSQSNDGASKKRPTTQGGTRAGGNLHRRRLDHDHFRRSRGAGSNGGARSVAGSTRRGRRRPDRLSAQVRQRPHRRHDADGPVQDRPLCDARPRRHGGRRARRADQRRGGACQPRRPRGDRGPVGGTRHVRIARGAGGQQAAADRGQEHPPRKSTA